MKHIKMQIVLIVVVLIAALASVFLLQYRLMASVNRVSEERILSLLSDNSIQVRDVLDNQMSNIWTRIDIVNSSLKSFGDMTREQAVKFLKNTLPMASNVELVTKDGQFIDRFGQSGYIEHGEEVAPLFEKGERICMHNQSGEKDSLIFGMPVVAVNVDQTVYQFVLAYYKLDGFIQLLSDKSFAGEGDIRVVNSKGTVLLYSDNLNQDLTNYSFFEEYKTAQYFENYGISDFDSFKESVMRGDNHAVHVKMQDGSERVVSYAKVENMDLFVTIIVDFASVLGGLDESIQSIGTTSIVATMAVVVIAAVLVLIIGSDILKMRKEKQQYQEIIDQSLKTFAGTIDAKDKYTNGHSLRVAKYSQELARRMNMNKSEQERIYYIAMLHDIGKIGVPDSILNKPGKLTDEERRIIQQHPAIGAEILKNYTALKDVAYGAKYHHERYDGTGYCEGLSGKDIPLVARIIGVADTYDAMSSKRCYRDPLSSEYIVGELKRVAGTQLDPEIVPYMIEMIEDGTAPINLSEDGK